MGHGPTVPSKRKTTTSDRAAKPKKGSPPKGQMCAGCGHWSISTEYGLDDRSGYCDRWEKITSRDYWCDEFISRDDFAKYQNEMAADNEEYLDDDA